MSLAAYLPADRRYALSQRVDLPEQAYGTALFADISGFTSFTEALARELGPRRGAEELTRQLNLVYDALIAEVDRYGGSVIGFAGDAITCWFDNASFEFSVLSSQFDRSDTQNSNAQKAPETQNSAALRAVGCATAMQQAMRQFGVVATPAGGTVALAMKVGLATGVARRFLVGDPNIQLLDVLAGPTIDRMAVAEQQAHKGEVVLDQATLAELGGLAEVVEWRTDAASGERFAILAGLQIADCRLQIDRSDNQSAICNLQSEMLRPWLLPPVYERIQAGQGAFLAELRPAVALFLGFGGIDYDNDPSAGAKLDAYIRWVQSILARYDAYVLQMTMGDKGCYLYAAFGAPLAHDDDVLRAVAAALELRSPPEWSAVSGVKIGLSRGRMRTGAYGGTTRRTYGALGDEVNMAARLMAKAQPGQILVSQFVAAPVAQVYLLESIGQVTVKGKQIPVTVSAVVGRRPPDQSGPMGLFAGSLVGRERELAQLDRVLDEVLASAGLALRLIGAAGVGKSHLAATFSARAMGRGFQVAACACQSILQEQAYAAWGQLFRSLAGLNGSEADQIAQLEALVVAANPDWELRLPLLGDLLDLPIADNATTTAFEPRLRQEALFALVVDLVRHWAQAQPLLLLIDDAQWMDEASAGLSLALGRVLERLPLLLVLAQRPPLREDRPLLPELSGLPSYQSLALEELAPDAVAALVGNRLQGSVDPLALALIQAQAQGNPFFAEELADALRETSALVRQNGGWHLSAAMLDALHDAKCLLKDPGSGSWVLAPNAQLTAVSLGIPDSIHGAVLSRIDRLPEDHKLTLKVASVVGQSFEFAVLRQCHPARPGQDALLEQIALLETRDFTRLELPPPNLAYMFKHNITQEVSYQTLLESQQRELHQTVGETLERLQPDAIEQLAFHFRRSGLREKAILYLDRAAHKAQAEYANETALSYYKEALALEQRWQWRRGQAEVLHILGRREEEQAALRMMQAAPDAPAFTVAYMWGQYYEAVGDYKAAQEAVERALDACRLAGERVDEVRCLAQLGLIARRQGDYERAKSWYQQALALFPDEQAGSDAEARALAQVLNGLGIVLRQQGRFDEARVCYERAMMVSMLSGDRRGEAEALNGLGVTAYYQRNFVEALPYHQQALEIRRVIGDRTGEGTSLLTLAQVNCDAGNYIQAKEYYLAALMIQQTTGNRWEEVNVWNGLGVLYHLLGDLTNAQTCLQQGLLLSQEIGDEAGQAYILGNLALVMYDRSDFVLAEELLKDGLTLAEKYNDKYLMSFFLSHLATVYLYMHKPEEAVSYANKALVIRQELNLDLWMTADLATLAAAYLSLADTAKALDYADQVLTILEKCQGEGPELPQQDYFTCYQVLAAFGQSEAAQVALQSAYELVMARANKISDPDLHASFLERVRINREIVQEAERVLRHDGDKPS